MGIEGLATKYYKSLPVEERLVGDEIFKTRKESFKLIESTANYLQVEVPYNPRSAKKIMVSFETHTNKIKGYCNCTDFKRRGFCKHVATGVLFIKNLKLGNETVESGNLSITSNINRASTSDSEFDLALLFHFGVGELRIKVKPSLLLHKKSGTTIERFSGLPQLKAGLMNKLPDSARQIILELEADSKGFLMETYGINGSYFTDETELEQFRQFFFSRLKRLWPFLLEYPHIYKLQSPLPFRMDNIEPIQFGNENPIPEFFVFQEGEELIIQLKFSIGETICDANFASTDNSFFVVANEKYYLLQDYEYVKLVKTFKGGRLNFPVKSRLSVYEQTILALKEKYKVSIDEGLGLNFKTMEPEPYVLVAEYLNQYLMMIPQFEYEDHRVAYGDDKVMVNTLEGEGYIIVRNRDFEKHFFEKLRPLHPRFSKQLQKPFFYVPFDEVMKGSWFLKTIRKLQQENVLVKGFENLKRFKHSTSPPKFSVAASSGIDWFDLKIKFGFEKMDVPLEDIRNAIFSGQKMVVLGDGSFGVLPEDWLAQFEGIFKMGTLKGDTIRLNKKYFNLLLSAEAHLKEANMVEELKAKRQSLVQLEEVKFAPLSKAIKAKLRPYQHKGFQWMQSLDHLGWGGCLADDMGLGKTLQTISFLQFINEKHKHSCNLVVCPTSLIYNWENELKQFAPSLKYYIHYGANRSFSAKLLKEYDVILTSYGTMRNDIDELKKHTFQYVILDESQVIKNPIAQITKACMLLNAKNRLILSGTPIQNNTFDLYAQMHFLNPGFLGKMNFFKNHFALPIDKYRDNDAVLRLKKMTEPFILRRTKETVATDLPDKSEIVLWCRMKDQQREVYERYKAYYRLSLLEKINENGLKKSTFDVLEGLTRLRQICDSPALVNDPDITSFSSIKIDELLREVSENTGAHKVLIFSQFTQMLSLIRERLDKAGLTYCYLDGKTSAQQRKETVEVFQNDDSIKIFLISLKAGGVGLNLTAADYVYLVDPWWNPATESQAIDRSHRIGQTKKVFAYKMICKDTIEEKILQLQESKKSLSKELIGEESSFVSKLTKEDIEFLFE